MQPRHRPTNRSTRQPTSGFYYGGQRYSSFMRQYTFGLATCQSTHYAIAKLFELPANGLALVTTRDLRPILERLHLDENDHYLTVGCSPMEQLSSEVQRVQNLSNEQILRMRIQSQKTIHERHLTTHRAQLVHVRLLSQALMASNDTSHERVQ